MNPHSLADRAQFEGVDQLTLNEALAVAVSRRASDIDGFLKVTTTLVQEKRGLEMFDVEDQTIWSQQFGLDEFELLKFQAAVKVGSMLGNSVGGEREDLSSPDAVYKVMKDIQNQVQEHFYLLILDTKAKLKRRILLHKGTLDSSLVGPREVFRFAVREAASSIVCVHNHPSGDPTPSEEDIAITQKLADLGRALDIPLRDHVIIGKTRFKSLRRENLFKYYD